MQKLLRKQRNYMYKFSFGFLMFLPVLLSMKNIFPC